MERASPLQRSRMTAVSIVPSPTSDSFKFSPKVTGFFVLGKASRVYERRRGGDCLNRKEGIFMTIVLLGTFVSGVFASTPASQLLNVFVTNFPQNQNVTVTNPGTHIGQSVNSLVSLPCNVVVVHFFNPVGCDRVFSNGTRVRPFSIPAGSDLVVTDVSWEIVWEDTAAFPQPGTQASFSIALVNSTGSPHAVFLASSIVPQYSSGAGLVESGGSEHMTAGFVVSSTTTMEAATDGTGLNLFLNGYLTTEA